jgi:hypothetical protein
MGDEGPLYPPEFCSSLPPFNDDEHDPRVVWLCRSDNAWAQAVRGQLERCFAGLPPAQQDYLARRLRSTTDTEFVGAKWELFLADYFAAHGWDVKCQPRVGKGKGDLQVSRATGDVVMVEVHADTGWREANEWYARVQDYVRSGTCDARVEMELGREFPQLSGNESGTFRGRVHARLAGKANGYRSLAVPFVLAECCEDAWPMDSDESVEFCYGTRTVELRRNAAREWVQTGTFLACDGFFTAPLADGRGQQAAVSALLYCTARHVEQGDLLSLRILHNPLAAWPLPREWLGHCRQYFLDEDTVCWDRSEDETFVPGLRLA